MGLFRRPLVASVALAVAFVPLAAAFSAPASAATGPAVAVVVRGPSVDAAAAAVGRAGGHVGLHLDLIGGVAATVPAGALVGLRSEGLSVVPDATAKVVDDNFSATDADPQLSAMDPGKDWDATAGAGIGVALVDTGVIDSPALAGRLERSPDFSGEGDGVDHYGHGTFMAGLIAGAGAHPGVAPGARIISVKVAGADGSTSLSKVIAGIGWVVVHQDEVGASVLNLSLGVDAPMPYEMDPLSAAVEAAWSSGLTVVVASGNSGAGDVTSPGRDPYVLTVGAVDTHGTTRTGDDSVAPWSGSDSFRTYAKPDVLASGVSVISLRAPGSTVDVANPSARIGDDYFKGSGTSMATAMAAGSAAVLLEHHPQATPDDIKGALTDTARSLGHKTIGGVIDLRAADHAKGDAGWDQHFPIAFDGLGVHMKQMPWVGSRWSGSRWSGSTWSGSRWSGSTWSGSRWSGSTWSGSTWSGSTWSGSRWSGSTWSGSTWSGSTWSGSTWSGSRWSGSTWSGSSWSGSRWSDVDWAGSSWSGSSWSGAGWGDASPAE